MHPSEDERQRPALALRNRIESIERRHDDRRGDGVFDPAPGQLQGSEFSFASCRPWGRRTTHPSGARPRDVSLLSQTSVPGPYCAPENRPCRVQSCTAQWTAQQVVEAFPWDEAHAISCRIVIALRRLSSTACPQYGHHLRAIRRLPSPHVRHRDPEDACGGLAGPVLIAMPIAVRCLTALRAATAQYLRLLSLSGHL